MLTLGCHNLDPSEDKLISALASHCCGTWRREARWDALEASRLLMRIAVMFQLMQVNSAA
jgi:hypothetical protein